MKMCHFKHKVQGFLNTYTPANKMSEILDMLDFLIYLTKNLYEFSDKDIKDERTAKYYKNELKDVYVHVSKIRDKLYEILDDILEIDYEKH